MGYRPATTAERERANDDDEYNEMLKKSISSISISPLMGRFPKKPKKTTAS